MLPEMKYKTFGHMNCSLAQTMSVIGERWTLLILRDAFLGVRRFAQFQRNLGIAKNILSNRLQQLVEHGILEKVQHDGRHAEYLLTQKGLDLQPALLALTQWGDKHMPDPRGERLIFIDRKSQKPIQPMAVVANDGRKLKPRDVSSVVGPALTDDHRFKRGDSA